MKKVIKKFISNLNAGQMQLTTCTSSQIDVYRGELLEIKVEENNFHIWLKWMCIKKNVSPDSRILEVKWREIPFLLSRKSHYHKIEFEHTFFQTSRCRLRVRCVLDEAFTLYNVHDPTNLVKVDDEYVHFATLIKNKK